MIHHVGDVLRENFHGTAFGLFMIKDIRDDYMDCLVLCDDGRIIIESSIRIQSFVWDLYGVVSKTIFL